MENRIKDYREKNKMTQKDLAKQMNLSRSSVSLYESGHYTPDVYTALLFASVLRCTVADLFLDEA
jgi:DNA-binding XRE family transcriptional regulator